jgi:hypothetical protein
LPNAIKIAIPIVELIIAVIKRITDAVVYVSENIGAPIEAIKTAFVNVKNWISDRVGDIVGFFDQPPRQDRQRDHPVPQASLNLRSQGCSGR